MIETSSVQTEFDVYAIRQQFPILQRLIKGKPLVYFDNAATSQKPQVVIDALVEYYSGYNANIHRGLHSMAEEATAAYEETRQTARAFINANSIEEIVFTKGVTEGINLVANGWGRKNVGAGDEVLITEMEHHSNIVPWYELCKEKGATLKVVPITPAGELDMDAFENLISEKTRIVSVVHVSNSLGTVNPVETIIEKAHSLGAVVMLDGAQSSVHLDIDVQALDCDFYAFGSHKIYGPTGVGVLYGKATLLQNMYVYQGGGEMIKDVRFNDITYNDLPYKFEAGTPNIADTIAFKFALDFVTETGKDKIRSHEEELLAYATDKLLQVEGLRIIGTSEKKVSVVSFIVDKVHPQDLGILLDNKGVAVRTGHHCTQPVMDKFNIPGTTRASFAMYNTTQEIDVMVNGINKAVQILR